MLKLNIHEHIRVLDVDGKTHVGYTMGASPLLGVLLGEGTHTLLRTNVKLALTLTANLILASMML